MWVFWTLYYSKSLIKSQDIKNNIKGKDKFSRKTREREEEKYYKAFLGYTFQVPNKRQ